MSLAMLIIGIGRVLVGGYTLLRRNVIVARLRARSGAGYVQPPVAYAVVGAILGLAGVFVILAAAF